MTRSRKVFAGFQSLQGRMAGYAAAIPASLSNLRSSAHDCRACDLWKHATQTVFGEGPAKARIMLVGEQPGDQEDLAGHPFVGPAGNYWIRH